MAKIHVLKANTNGKYQTIVHVIVPGGNNSANKPWKDVLLAVNVTGPKANTRPHDTIPGDTVYNASRLVTGEDGHAWQIPAAELTALELGNKIEILVKIQQKTGMSQAEVDFLATKEANEWLAKESLKYKYYGWSYAP